MFASDNGCSEPIEILNFKFPTGVNLTKAGEQIQRVNNSLNNLGKERMSW